MSTGPSIAERMMRLYAGASDRSHYVADFTNCTIEEKSGKRVPDYRREGGPAALDAFEDHLAGRKGLLLVPVTPEGTSRWGKIDIDYATVGAKGYPIDTEVRRLAAEIHRLRLPLLTELSKSGGAHLAWYAHRELSGLAMRERLVDFASNFRFSGKAEIFPTDDRIDDGGFGMGINLPYFGGENAVNHAIDHTGRALTVEEWLSRAETVIPEKPALGAADVQSAAELLVRHWTDGQRDNLNLAVIGALLRAQVEPSDIEQLVNLTQDIGADNQQHKSADSVQRYIDAGKRVPGLPKLMEIIGREDAHELLRLMGAEGVRTQGGETITIQSGQLKDAVDEALGVLSKCGVAANVFARGQALVRPYMVQRRGFKDESVESLELAELTAAALGYELNKLVNFFGFDSKGRARRLDCPPRLAGTVLAVPHRWGALPALEAIAAVPIYLGGGRLLADPGYHAARGVWLTVPAGVQCAERPSKAEAQAALARLGGWIEEFSFASAVDRSVMLGGMMTAAMRPSLPGAPAFGFDAPEFGTGKSTAAKLVHIVGTGRAPAVMPYSEDPEEMRKHIHAVMLEGRQSIVIDNVPAGTVLTSPVLAQLLTEPFMQARELGLSRSHTLPCVQLVLVTGNNLQVADDLTRRFLVSRQDPHGDPTARRFKRPELLSEAQASRAQILSDVFTIVGAFEASGERVEAETLVGYSAWARWCRDPLVWLGEVDPVESVRRLTAEDPDRDTLDLALALWHEAYGSEWVAVKELATYDRNARAEQREAASALAKALTDEAGKDREGNLDRRKVGQWLRRMKQRWTPGGLRLEQRARGDANTKRSGQWRVVAVVEGKEGSGGFAGTRSEICHGSNERTEREGGNEKPSATLLTLHDDDL